MADVHSKAIRSYNMSRIRSTGTKIELLLAKELWSRGIRYRKNDKTITGKPDFAFKTLKLAVFCDSEFWHGKDLETLKNRIGTNNDFWVNKITNNIARDQKVNAFLTEAGWTVLRYWEKDIKKNVSLAADEIIANLDRIKQIKIKEKLLRLQQRAP